MKWSHALTSNTGLNLLQTLARMLFAILTLFYFIQSDSGLSLRPVFYWGLVGGYLFIQVVLLKWQSGYRTILSNVIDIAAVTGLVIIDPLTPAPTLVLFLVCTLSAGILFGLNTFLYMLVLSSLATAAALPLHNRLAGVENFNGTLFLVAALALCAVYFLFSLIRLQLQARDAARATLNHPDTGLFSEKALIRTAGWLVPLHDRLGTSLSIVLFAPVATATPKELVAVLTHRIRRSDIAGHYGDALAVLFPATKQEELAKLLNELHNHKPIFRAAAVTLASNTRALEPLLQHLEQTLKRTNDKEQWLAHASQLD